MSFGIFFISILVVAYCRPQSSFQKTADETEKRQIFKSPKSDKDLEANTREILEKIALVNERYGLNKKKTKPYYHYPFSYVKSLETGRQRSDFQFPTNPYSNPIFEYLANNQERFAQDPSVTYVNKDAPNDNKDEVPPGHYIKRKITHQQTILIPSQIPQYVYGELSNPMNMEHKKDEMEKQTIANIKKIVQNSEQNPYFQPYHPYNFYNPIYSPMTRQFQSPLSQYFPIIIKDPFVQMLQALTTMIEYGPQQGGAADACKKTAKAKQITNKKLSYSIVDHGEGAEITVDNKNSSNLQTVIDIEDLRISDEKNDSLEFKLNVRQSRQMEASNLLKQHPILPTVEIKNETSRQSPPNREPELYEDEETPENDKAEGIHVSNEGAKKLVSKDNTGSGIFVHKIKVRKGGVAIAGPGGIATAGSGGTAIVGPNGFAYTHPDSLAIAGSGTKVVAVEPNVNLSDVILEHSKNKTRQTNTPTRLGKIVAVGPVIYYNKG